MHSRVACKDPKTRPSKSIFLLRQIFWLNILRRGTGGNAIKTCKNCVKLCHFFLLFFLLQFFPILRSKVHMFLKILCTCASAHLQLLEALPKTQIKFRKPKKTLKQQQQKKKSTGKQGFRNGPHQHTHTNDRRAIGTKRLTWPSGLIQGKSRC